MSEEQIVITPDFSETRNYEPVPAGNYRGRIEAVRGPSYPKKADQDTGLYDNGDQASRQLAVDISNVEVEGRWFPVYYAAIEGSFADRFRKLVRAVDPTYEGGEVNTLALVGMEVMVRVEDDMYQDRKVNNIKAITAAE